MERATLGEMINSLVQAFAAVEYRRSQDGNPVDGEFQALFEKARRIQEKYKLGQARLKMLAETL